MEREKSHLLILIKSWDISVPEIQIGLTFLSQSYFIIIHDKGDGKDKSSTEISSNILNYSSQNLTEGS